MKLKSFKAVETILGSERLVECYEDEDAKVCVMAVHGVKDVSEAIEMITMMSGAAPKPKSKGQTKAPASPTPAQTQEVAAGVGSDPTPTEAKTKTKGKAKTKSKSKAPKPDKSEAKKTKTTSKRAAPKKPDPEPEQTEEVVEGAPKEAKPATGGGNGEISEEVKKISKMRDLLVYLHEHGHESEDAIAVECARLQEHIPFLQRISNLDDRVRRAYTVLGLGESN